MDITQGVYPDFPTEATLEELTLSMARKILSQQKDLTLNPTNKDYISISIDEESEEATIDLEALEVDITGGILTAQDYFTGATFQAGTGSYPFNRTTLTDAFVHCALWQNAMEINRVANPDQDLKYITVSMSQGNWGVGLPLRLTINMANIPIIVELDGGFSKTKARSYLSNLA